MSKSVTIEDTTVPIVEYQDQRVKYFRIHRQANLETLPDQWGFIA